MSEFYSGQGGYFADPILFPSGDTSGKADYVTIKNAIANLPGRGGRVRLAPGVYWSNSPIVLPAGVKLSGLVSFINDTSGNYDVNINRATGWSQGSAPKNALIVANGTECGVGNLDLNSNFPLPAADCDAIAGTGIATNFRVHDVSIRGGFLNGVSGAANTWYCDRVSVTQCYSNGFNGIPTDSIYTNCVSSENNLANYLMSNPINSKLIGCKSEFSASAQTPAAKGFYITGDNTATGGFSMTGCSTDRNAGTGLYIDATGNWPINITDLMMRRDASDGTDAAIQIANNTTCPVVFTGLTMMPGFFDDGSGIQSPVTGILVGTGVTYVSVAGGYIHAVTTPVSGVITQIRSLATTTGSWFAPTAVVMITDTA